MNRYKYTKLRNLGPVHGFMIHTPDDRQLKDIYPEFIVLELNHLNDRIQNLIAERDTARLQADQNWSLRKEFESLLGTDKIEEGVAAVTAMKDRIKQLEAVVNDPQALWTNWLRGTVKLPAGIGDVRQYQKRIKRLEEAGDEMHRTCDAISADKWRKAKGPTP